MIEKQYVSVFQHRGKIYETFRDTDFNKHTKEVKGFKYKFFIETNKETEWKDFITSKINLKPLEFDTVREYNDKIKNLKDYDVPVYGTVKPENQYREEQYINSTLSEELHFSFFDIETGFDGSFLDENGELIFGSGGFPKPDKANSSVIAITMYSCKTKKYYSFGVKNYTPKRGDVKYRKCKDEKDLINSFFKTVNLLEVDLLSAWNGDGFDYPFLVNRMKNLGMDISIIDKYLKGIYGKSKPGVYEFEKPRTYYWTDYLEMYKKFIFTPREKYSLEFIGQAELGEGKVNLDNSDLQELYRDNFEKFQDYSIKDVELMVQLDNKLKLMSLTVELSRSYNINFDEVFATTSPWAQLLYSQANKRNLVLPKDFSYINESMNFEGGWVSANPGYYEWIVSYDFASLYPNIIISYNMCPSTILFDKDLPEDLLILRNKYFSDRSATYETISNFLELSHEAKEEISKTCQKYNVSVSPTGDYFDNARVGIIPEIVEEIYNGRKKDKRQMLNFQGERQKLVDANGSTEEIEKLSSLESIYDNKQMSKKLQINSLYGAMTSNMFILFNEAIGRSITSSGRLLDRYGCYKISESLSSKWDYSKQEVMPNSDTDSGYFSLKPLVDDAVNRGLVKNEKWEIVNFIEKKVEPFLDKITEKSMGDLANTFNIYRPEKIEFEREVIADCGISIGKKSYCLNVLNSEGTVYENGKLKVIGLQLKKTNIPGVVRKELQEFLKDILFKKESEFQSHFKDYKGHFYQMDPVEVSLPKGVNLISEKRGVYTLETSGIPIHVRASLLYNNYIDEKNLNTKYQKIENGNKMKFIYMKTPNPIGQNVIGWLNDVSCDSFVESEGLREFVDYDKLFENNVFAPLEKLVEYRGWEFKKTNKLF